MRQLKKKLKHPKKILLHVVVFDFLFLLICYLLTQFFNNLITTQYNKILSLNYELAGMAAEELQLMSSTMQSVFFIIVALVIIFLVLMLANWSFFQGLVYSKITDKRFRLKSFLKFLLLNLGWIPTFIIVLAIIWKGVKTNLQLTFAVTVIVLFIYFTNILYILFIKNNKISAVKQTFRIGIFKFYRLILPHLLLVAILIGLRQLNVLFQKAIANLPVILIIKQIPLIILALIAIDLTRIYIAKIVLK